MSNFERVRQFHIAMGQPVRERPTARIPREEADLRLDLIEEELEELREAVEDNDIVGIADALADLEYVTHGAALYFGIPQDHVFREVHRSNMTKIKSDGTVEYREDGKVLKPDTFEEPDIANAITNGTLEIARRL